jgi:adenosylmethionine-8-amino-7-oxononanoate aminotransferase
MGNEMTTSSHHHEPGTPAADAGDGESGAGSEHDRTEATRALQAAARRHLWMHFTRMGAYGVDNEVPIIERGEGAYVWDSRGRRYLDGLAGLFVVQVGHGRHELAEAAAKQAAQLAYFPIWSYAHPMSITLAERLAEMAPGDLNRVFFTTGGSEAVESAWKLARQYFAAIGQPGRYKVISRSIAYHGTTMGALSITGLPGIRNPFEPLVPGAIKVPNTNFYRAREHGDDIERFGVWAADAIEQAIIMEGPASVAAVFLEPVQNSGGCFVPPPGYFQRVREICDRYGVLLVSDEVICAFGRLGKMFGCERYDYLPDILTCAKGLTSGYAPLGAMICRDELIEPFLDGKRSFLHGITFAGHPVSCAVAHANLDVFEREDIVGHVQANEAEFRRRLEGLRDLPLVGDVRGAGFFYGIELVKDRNTKETFSEIESEQLLRGFLSPALFEAGLICRADDRGDPVIQLSPPLVCGTEQFDEIEQILRSVLSEAWERL